jgi:uncharacterized protein
LINLAFVTDPELSPVRATSPASTTSPNTAGPWGPWATAGLSLIIALSFVGAQTAVVVVMLLQAGFRNRSGSVSELATNGLTLSLATFASTPATLGLSWLFATLRPGITARDYLALQPVPVRRLVRWCVALLAMLVCFDVTTTLLDRPVVPEVMINAYRSAEVLPLMWMALVVGAPLAEEVFFRGFLFKGLVHSRLGTAGAILVTASVWAAIHLQYDLYGMAIIFVTGLMFGFARARTGSIYPSVVMHALMNLLATAQVDLLVRYGE